MAFGGGKVAALVGDATVVGHTVAGAMLEVASSLFLTLLGVGVLYGVVPAVDLRVCRVS